MHADLRSTQLRLLTLQFEASLGGFDTRPLDAFVADKELLDVREHFFLVRGLPYLACLITFRATARSASPSRRTDSRGPSRRSQVELSEDDRLLFDTLRTWRRHRSREDGVPPYVIFTDRELAGLARARPTTASALLNADGVGARKVERYGQDLLRFFVAPGTEVPVSEEP